MGDLSRIDRPLFFFGTGRNGTTLAYKLAATHPDLAWFSNYSTYGWFVPGAALVNRVHDVPGLRRRLFPMNERLTPKPWEVHVALERLTDGTFTLPRRLDATDVDPRHELSIRRAMLAHQRAMRRPRFLMKHTGFPRMRYLGAMFPDARFVHIQRDGRAVASSLVQVDWWKGMDSWWWEPMAPRYRALWEESGQDDLVLAGIVWCTLMDYAEQARAEVAADRFLEIRFDELTADPVGTMARIFDHAELPTTGRALDAARALEVTSDNDRWRAKYAPERVQQFEELLGADFARHGYPG